MAFRTVSRSLFFVVLVPLLGCEGGGTEVEPERPRYEEYVRADDYLQLVMEVDSVAVAAPNLSVQQHVESVLASVVNKPMGVEIVRDQTLAPRGSDYMWTLEELGVLVDETSDLEVNNLTVKMHALFLDGGYAGDSAGSHTLGIAWADYQHMVIFKEKLKDLCTSGIYASMTEADNQMLCENSESALWLHEVGHLLGLVNRGVNMATEHEDPAHPGHTKSEESVMHWGYEWSALNGGIVDQIYKRIMVSHTDPLDFGVDCEADLAVIREAP